MYNLPVREKTDLTITVERVLHKITGHIYRPSVVAKVIEELEEKNDTTFEGEVREALRYGVYKPVAKLMDKRVMVKGVPFKKFLGLELKSGTENLYVPLQYATKQDYRNWLAEENKRNTKAATKWKKECAKHEALLNNELARASEHDKIMEYLKG